jgi:hypothetical protein
MSEYKLLKKAKEKFAAQEALDTYMDMKFCLGFLTDIFKKEHADMNKTQFEKHLEFFYGEKVSIKEYLEDDDK